MVAQQAVVGMHQAEKSANMFPSLSAYSLLHTAYRN
jgi:hypothetical protein